MANKLSKNSTSSSDLIILCTFVCFTQLCCSLIQLLLINTLLGNAWHVNFYLGITLYFATGTQINTQRTFLTYFTQEKYTGVWLNHEGKGISSFLYCGKHHSIDEYSSRSCMCFQYFNQKVPVVHIKIYAAPCNNFAEPVQCPWASLVPLRLLCSFIYNRLKSLSSSANRELWKRWVSATLLLKYKERRTRFCVWIHIKPIHKRIIKKTNKTTTNSNQKNHTIVNTLAVGILVLPDIHPIKHA